jgi:hypothetical protein
MAEPIEIPQVPRASFNLCYFEHMEITFNIPDELGQRVTSQGKDPAGVVLETLALEGYRSELVSESAVRRMLGFETRMEVHDSPKRHDGYLHYHVADV